MQVFRPCWVNVCIWCEGAVQLDSFACGYPLLLAPFAEETVISLGSHGKEPTINRGTHLWTLTTVPLIYIYLYSSKFWNIVGSSEIRKCESSNSVLFSRLPLLFGVPCNSMWILGSAHQFLEKKGSRDFDRSVFL